MEEQLGRGDSEAIGMDEDALRDCFAVHEGPVEASKVAHRPAIGGAGDRAVPAGERRIRDGNRVRGVTAKHDLVGLKEKHLSGRRPRDHD